MSRAARCEPWEIPPGWRPTTWSEVKPDEVEHPLLDLPVMCMASRKMRAQQLALAAIGHRLGLPVALGGFRVSSEHRGVRVYVTGSRVERARMRRIVEAVRRVRRQDPRVHVVERAGFVRIVADVEGAR